ncbi:MAG: putative rane-bound dehydrogenase [Verrucomicrobiales bacterium]|nr:putative rane-bound dehydrogenase [Verrucomicrobiales bacterium]
MHSLKSAVPATLALLFAALPFCSAAEPVALFNGTSLQGWTGSPERWRVEEGAITGEIKAGESMAENQWIYWSGELNDFELEADYRITGGPAANSGIQIRSTSDAQGRASGLQCDLDEGNEWLGRIYDEHGRALVMERGTRVSIAPDGRRWADPFAEAATFKSVPKPGDWNRYRIKAVGSHVEVWVNNVFFGALDDHETKAAEWSGKLAFQLHAGPGPSKVQFKNIRLTDLGKTPLPPALAAAQAKTGPAAIQAVGDDGAPLNLNFETGTLKDWTSEGNAWEGQPIKGDTVTTRKPGQNSLHAGEFWIGGYEPAHTDAGTGKLTSAAFKVTQPWASFLVGGSSEVAAVRVEIVDAENNKVFHTAGGRAEENMHREIVDMRPLLNKKVFLRLIDRSVEPWDHLNFDDFVFHTEPPVELASPMGRQNTSPVLWHLRDNPAKPTAVANAEAQQTVANMKLTQGFQAELIAAEPDVKQPIGFCIDEKGRLWVLEGYSYPNKQPEGKGKDRILIFADKDGDGVFESRTVFAEGINLASGIEVGFGGVFVGAAPELLFFADKNGDDKADGPPTVLLDGWGYQDTHETLNSFSWGPDGWLYGCHGVFTYSLVGKPGTPKEQRQRVRAGVWRLHPVTGAFELFANGGSNQWGLDYNEYGHLFMTHCRSFFGGGGTTYVIRNGHYWNQANAGYEPFISNEGPDFAPELKNYLPAAALYDSGEGGAGKPGSTAVFGGHSHVGTMIYQGDNWPAAYQGHLFTHNLHGHQMNHQVNVRKGSGYETMHAGADLAYTPDPRYMAVDLQSGPDGAVYTIDWVDQQHCHTPIEEKWDRTNGRIYRLSWAETFKPVKVDLATYSDVELAKLQSHPDVWHRRHARRLLMERAAAGGVKPEAISILTEFAKSSTPTLALRGLWALSQCNALTSSLVTAAAAHPAEQVRSWAVQLGTPRGSAALLEPALLSRMAKEDPSAMVRLALASALPEIPDAQRWDVGSALALHTEDAGDRFLPKVLWFGLSSVVSVDWNRSLALAAATPLPELADSIRWAASLKPEGRDALTASLTKLPPDQAGRVVRLMAFGLREETNLPAPAQVNVLTTAVGTAPGQAVAAALDELSALFGDRSVLGKMRAVLANPAASMAERRSAFTLLKRTGDPEALPVFASLVDIPQFRSAVIPLMGRSDDPAVATALMSRYVTFSPADRSAALAALTSRKSLALVLAKAMADGGFDKKNLTSLHLRQMRQLGSDDLNALLEKSWGKFNASAAGSKETIAKFKKLYSEAPLWAFDAAKGKEVFAKTCATCHAYSDGTAKIGPDLGGTWGNGLDYFLENIADPNAVIGDDFQLTIVTKNDGNVIAGAVEKDTDTAVTLRTITETLTVPKSEIKSREKLAQSLMPPGLLDAMPEREAIELLKFLSTKP